MREGPGPIRQLFALMLSFVVVGAFGAFVMTNAVDSNLADESYYEDTLESENAYDRVYSEVFVDPVLEDDVEALLGGVDVPREEAIEVLRELVDEAYLREQAGQSIAEVVAYVDGESTSLDLAIDVTPIIGEIDEVALRALDDALDGIPVREVATLAEFRSEVEQVADSVARGEVPGSLPSFAVPAASREAIALVIIGAGAGDLSPAGARAAAEVAAALANGDTAAAIRAGAPLLADDLIERSRDFLVTAQYIETREVDGETRYYLRPPAESEARIERRLELVRDAETVAAWMRPVAAAVAVGASLLILLALLPFIRSGLGWIGFAWLLSGIAVALTWLAAQPALEREAQQAAIGSAEGLPPSFVGIVHDVTGSAVSGLSPDVLVPAAVAGVAGAVLLVVSRIRR